MRQERGVVRRGLLRMHAQTQYREFAEECDRLAEQVQTTRHRLVLKEMAEAWRKLAKECDRAGEEVRC